jgi:hypothetical protein
MTWFSLPMTQADNKAAFADAAGAALWLAGQPQTNAPFMQAELTRQIQSLNVFRLAPRERFEILEALRKTIFAVDGECQRRFEHRALPLAPVERDALDASHRLWRACAIGYLHCLRAVLDDDLSLAEITAKTAHRALVALRMEQMSCYLGGLEIDAELWRHLHAIEASAEQLRVAHEPVTDRRLAETRESTVSGQYAMALLLHLARPFELTRAQFFTATHCLARWREQAEILLKADDRPKAYSIPLDLAQGHPTQDSGVPSGMPRWLSIGGVLRKIRKRLEALDAGESPESLKLGSGISREAATFLLKTLADHLQHPLPALAVVPPDAPTAAVVVGLEAIYRQLGGKSLKAPAEVSSLNRREIEQIALFGQVAGTADEPNAPPPEAWRIVDARAAELHLNRPAGSGEARLSNKGLLAVRLPAQQSFALAGLTSLYARHDGSLCAVARLLPGAAQPLIAQVRERPMGQLSRQPAFLLPATEAGGQPSVIVPAGLPARALSISLLQEQVRALRLSTCVERGSDYERWTCEPGPTAE